MDDFEKQLKNTSAPAIDKKFTDCQFTGILKTRDSAVGFSTPSLELINNLIENKSMYEVALSFAGEDRNLVEPIAYALINSGVKVFYDRFDEVKLWGGDLTEELKEIYYSNSKACVVFISSNYTDKKWPKFERRNILARFIENDRYLLPVTIDGTEMIGLPRTIAYIEFDIANPLKIASQIIKKLKFENILKDRDIDFSKVPYLSEIRKPQLEGLQLTSLDGFAVNKKSKSVNFFLDGFYPSNTGLVNESKFRMLGSKANVRRFISKIKRGHLNKSKSSMLFEQMSLELLSERKKIEAFDLLLIGIDTDVIYANQTKKSPSTRLVDLAAIVNCRYRLERLDDLMRCISRYGSGDFGLRISNWTSDSNAWTMKWGNTHRHVRWCSPGHAGQVMSLVF